MFSPRTRQGNRQTVALQGLCRFPPFPQGEGFKHNTLENIAFCHISTVRKHRKPSPVGEWWQSRKRLMDEASACLLLRLALWENRQADYEVAWSGATSR